MFFTHFWANNLTTLVVVINFIEKPFENKTITHTHTYMRHMYVACYVKVTTISEAPFSNKRPPQTRILERNRQERR